MEQGPAVNRQTVSRQQGVVLLTGSSSPTPIKMTTMKTKKSTLGKLYKKALALLVAPLLLVACEQGMDISDEELVKRINECHAEDNKTPGMAVACGNYQDECKRRGKKTGNYFC